MTKYTTEKVAKFLEYNTEAQSLMDEVIDILRNLKINTDNDDQTEYVFLQSLTEMLAEDIEYIGFDQDLTKGQYEQLQKKLIGIFKTLGLDPKSKQGQKLFSKVNNKFWAAFIKTVKLARNNQDNTKSMDAGTKKQIEVNLKRSAIYEMYQMLNPNRIAGESKKENFKNNMKIGGFDYAKQYDGGKGKDLKKYSPEFIKQLEAEHRQFRGIVDRANKDRGGFGKGR